jgi:hypothetical protein
MIGQTSYLRGISIEVTCFQLRNSAQDCAKLLKTAQRCAD